MRGYNYLKVAGVGAFLMVLLSLPAFAETVKLKDGSVVQGEVVGVNLTEYTIKSPTLGVITVPKATIQSVGVGAGESSASDLQAVQAKITSNPAMMAQIQALASDPEIVELMSDPEFLKLIQSRDMNALQSNPRMMQLMSNPKIQALVAAMQGAN